jgi:hypothetical protein
LKTGRQSINMLPQWLRDRNHDSSRGLSRPQADLVLTKIQVFPGQRRDISQALADIQSKQNQTSPFWVCRRQYPLNFCDRKRAPLVVGAFANRVDKLARVFGDVAIPLRLAKERLDCPQVVVCGCRRVYLGADVKQEPRWPLGICRAALRRISCARHVTVTGVIPVIIGGAF